MVAQASTTCLSTTCLAVLLWSTSFPADPPATSPIRGWRLCAVAREPSPCGHRLMGHWIGALPGGFGRIFGLVMIGLLEMKNEQYDLATIAQSNWWFWGQHDLATCITSSCSVQYIGGLDSSFPSFPCHGTRQDGKLPGKICVQRIRCIEPCTSANSKVWTSRFREISEVDLKPVNNGYPLVN